MLVTWPFTQSIQSVNSYTTGALPMSSYKVIYVKVCLTSKNGSCSSWAYPAVKAALLQRLYWVERFICCLIKNLDEPKQPFRVSTSVFCLKDDPVRLYATVYVEQLLSW